MKAPGPLVAVALVAALPAQRVWIVDADQRPGTTHADLPPAVAAAAADDLILVRLPSTTPTVYTAPAVTKPLVILGEELGTTDKPTLAGSLTITGIGAGEKVTIASLRMSDGTGQAGLTVSSVQGRVLLANFDVEVARFVLGTPSTVPVTITDCAELILHGCRIQATPPGTQLVRSRLRALDSTLASPHRFDWLGACVPGGTGLVLRGSEARLSQSDAYGSGGSATVCVLGCTTLWSCAGRPGLDIDGASLVELGRDCTITGPRHSFSSYPLSTVTYSWSASGLGTLITDPAAILLGSSGGPVRLIQTVHDAFVSLPRFYDAAALELASESGAFALVAVGYPASFAQPTLYGPVWLDPAATFVLGVAWLGNGTATMTLPMTSSVLLGVPFGAQALMLLPNGSWTVSRPGFTTRLPARS